jgi:hypothetical protein
MQYFINTSIASTVKISDETLLIIDELLCNDFQLSAYSMRSRTS